MCLPRLGSGPSHQWHLKIRAQENPIRISIKLTISSKFWWVPDFQSASLGICILLSPPGCSARAAISASVASSANVVVEVVEGLMDKRKQRPGKDRSELKCQPPKNLGSRMANHPGAVSLGGKAINMRQTILWNPDGILHPLGRLHLMLDTQVQRCIKHQWKCNETFTDAGKRRKVPRPWNFAIHICKPSHYTSVAPRSLSRLDP